MSIANLTTAIKNLNLQQRILALGLSVLILGSFSAIVASIILSNSKIPKTSNANKDDTMSYPVTSYPSNEPVIEENRVVVSYPTNPDLPKSITYDVIAGNIYNPQTKTLTKYVEDTQKLIALIVIENTNLTGTGCDNFVYKYNGAGEKDIVDSRSIILDYYGSDQTFQLGKGNYEIKFDCFFDNEHHLQSFYADVVQAPGSVCDEVNISDDFESEGYDELMVDLIGTWKGCVNRYDSKPFRVQVTFLDNNSFVVKNIEVIENPNSVRAGSVFYSGNDNVELDYNFIETNGVTHGAMKYRQNDAPTLTSPIKISTDGSTLFIGGTTPLLLTKVE